MIKPLQAVVAVAAAAAIFAPAALAVDVRSEVRSGTVPRMDVRVDVRSDARPRIAPRPFCSRKLDY